MKRYVSFMEKTLYQLIGLCIFPLLLHVLKKEELEYLLLQVKEGAELQYIAHCTIQKHVLLLLLCLESFYVLTLQLLCSVLPTRFVSIVKYNKQKSQEFIMICCLCQCVDVLFVCVYEK